MRLGRIELNKLRGLADKAFGLSKEVVGSVAGSERLEREGEQQQARASQQLKALRNQVKAERREARQRTAQRARQHA
jgi:uncharacterized protein YjbJ (UPF0337 family)